jgi:hypothetical protein
MLGKPGAGILKMNGQPTAQNTRECGADGDLAGFRNWAKTMSAAVAAANTVGQRDAQDTVPSNPRKLIPPGRLAVPQRVDSPL